MIWFSNKRNILLLLLPTIFIYILYIILPIIIATWYSLTNFSGIGVPEFIGISNYERLIGDKIFWVSLKNTFIILFITLCLLIPGGFLIALLLNEGIRGSGFLRAINYSPAIIAPIMVGLIWVFILDPQIGLLNNILGAVGLENWTLEWIGGKTLTPYSISIVQMWQSLGYIATIFLAGLTLVPDELYEAARIDGANKVQQIFHVTIPMLYQTFQITLVLAITLIFKVFETVIQLTNGGPNHLSEVMVTYMYNTTFKSGEYGYGMSIAVVSLLVTFLAMGLIFLIIHIVKKISGTTKRV